jgi:Ca2+-transporting ATPase
VDQLAAQGKRLVGYAYRIEPSSARLEDLVFVRAVALEDPIRDEIGDAIARLRSAGVRTVMVTGDKAATARQVAHQVGLDGSKVVVGRELQSASEG